MCDCSHDKRIMPCRTERTGIPGRWFFIDTCTPYPYREEKTEILTNDNVKDNPNKFNTETNVIVESMGSGYPEVIEGASQVEDHLKTSVHARIHDEANFTTNLGDHKTGV